VLEELLSQDWLLRALVTALGAVIWWYLSSLRGDLKEYRREIKEFKDDAGREIKEVRDDLSQYKLSAAKAFVLKEDFIRNFSILDGQIEKVYDAVMDTKNDIAGIMRRIGKEEP